MQGIACARHAGLASLRRAFATIDLHLQQWSSASPEWPPNLDSTALKIFENCKNSLRFHEPILSYKFYSTDASTTVKIYEESQAVLSEDENPELQSLNSEDEDGTLAGSIKADETLDKKKWKLADAIKEMCLAVEKGDGDLDETLNRLGIHLSPLLAWFILGKIDSPNLALRFFQWAKLKPGFKHDTQTYDRLVNILGCSKDFEALQRVLAERSAACCSNSAEVFSFATNWHDDSDMLNKIMEMFEKLELSLRRDAYEMLIASLCRNNYVNAALMVLEKMASSDCAPRLSTYRPLIKLYCRKNKMDKVQEIFEMMKDSPQDSLCYNLVLSALCDRKKFEEVTQFHQSMVERGCKPDAHTYNIMIRAACKMGNIEGAIQLLDRLKEEGINPLYASYWHLLDSLLQSKGFDEAHSFLIQQCGNDSKLDTSNYNYFIGACRKSGRQEEFHNLLLEKKVNGVGVGINRW